MNFKLALAAAAVVGLAGTAQAADLAKKAPAAADYVKVCDAYGAGFFYIPGSETCLKIGGYVRVELRTGGHANTMSALGVGMKLGGGRLDNNLNSRVRVDVKLDARTNTELGLLRSYIELRDTIDSTNAGTNQVNVLYGFIQFAGLTVGRADSMFDFVQGSYNMGSIIETDASDHRVNLFAYTFAFGNGISATLSLEDHTTTDGGSLLKGPYSAVKMPDVVANLAVSQAWGRAQVMGALHQNYSSALVAGGLNQDKMGWAVGAGVEVNLPMLAAGDKLFLQAVYAKGAVSYAMNNNTGYLSNVVGLANPTTADFYALGASLGQSSAWSIAGGLQHNFSKTIEANLGMSYASYSDGRAVTAAIPDNDHKQFIVNAELKWKPVAGFYIAPAIEYRWVDYKDARIATGNQWAGFVRFQRNF